MDTLATGGAVGRGFVIASVCGLSLSVFFPSLLPFVLVGLVVGLAPLLVTLAHRAASRFPLLNDSQKRRALVGVAGAALIILAAVWGAADITRLSVGVGGGEGGGPPPLEAVIPITYQGVGVFHDNPPRLRVHDRLEVRTAALEQVGSALQKRLELEFPNDPLPAADHFAAQLLADIPSQLASDGWHYTYRQASGDVFLGKPRTVRLATNIVPADTPNQIDIPSLPRQTLIDRVYVGLRFAHRSHLSVLAPANTIDGTAPEATRRSRAGPHPELVVIPVEGSNPIRVDVRSPILRLRTYPHRKDFDPVPANP